MKAWSVVESDVVKDPLVKQEPIENGNVIAFGLILYEE